MRSRSTLAPPYPPKQQLLSDISLPGSDVNAPQSPEVGEGSPAYYYETVHVVPGHGLHFSQQDIKVRRLHATTVHTCIRGALCCRGAG